ncbi:hypothetical protein DFH09DRAFT_1386790, partial [Mycena vulgaris]
LYPPILGLPSDFYRRHQTHPATRILSLTVPNTPCPTKVGRVISEVSSRALPFAVPVIAPPPDHVARLPLSKEACAKIRIGNFLLREGHSRAADKLDELSLGGDDVGNTSESERLKWEHILGVGPELRAEAVEWLLEVLPKKSTYYPPISSASKCIFGSSKAPSASWSDTRDEDRPDLLDQLLTSPETRFHAAYMFTRYFFIVMGDSKERKKIEAMQEALAAANKQLPWDQSIPPDGWMLVAWDCCLACLAISVKFHRDVLQPLNPVFSWEFEALAPHQLTYEDLETAQRDILSTFSFNLGASPQPIFDELYLALASLRQLLNFRGGWKHAQKEAWELLFDAVTQPDILKFPISLLAVAALVEALVAALVSSYEYDASLNSHVIRRRSRKSQADSDELKQKLVGKAESEIEGVVQDIQAIVRISDEGLKVSRSWLRAAGKD